MNKENEFEKNTLYCSIETILSQAASLKERDRKGLHTILGYFGFGATFGVFIYFVSKIWRHIFARRP